MKFIKVRQQNNEDFLLINLANVNYIAVNNKSGTLKVFLNNRETITCFPQQGKALLDQVSEYNRQIVTFLAATPINGEDF